MYDVPQLLPLSPQSTRSRVSATPTRQSPSKPHVTPSKTRQSSPRKSPAKNRLFSVMSTKPVSFTPEKTKQPPRAWERRPATPYVPRDDKQKIWKRVPLGEIGIEPNRPVSISRREQDAAKDYVRVVKKLKVGHDSDDEDKENVSLGVKTDIESGDLKRRSGVDTRFVTTKMEKDVMQGSPKKKLRAFTNERSTSTAQEDAGDAANRSVNERGVVKNASHQVHMEQDATNDQYQNREDVTRDQENQISEGSISVITADTSIPTISGTDNPASSDSPTDASQMANEAHGSREALADLNIEANADGEITSDEPDDDEESVQQNLDVSNKISDTTMSEDQSLPSLSVERSEPVTYSADQQNAEMEVDQVTKPTTISEEPRSSSPPTILAENVVVDELESRNNAQSGASSDNQAIPSDSSDQQESEGREEQEPLSRRVSDDEATFLRNFISNTKAERAAREKKVQELQHVESNVKPLQTPEVQANLDTLAEDDSWAAEEAPSFKPAPTENTSSSPLRRSKRAVITGIPAPKIIPNAIQLKRANGNEFIFTANKAASAANIAVVTRSNTKRNKGSALNVTERLEQLATEKDGSGKNSNEQAQFSADDHETADKMASEGTSKDLPSRKRKRDTKDGTARAKKVLRWNDDNLVSYQEAEMSLDMSDEIDDSSQENVSPRDRGNEETDRHVKLTLTVSSNSSKDHSSTTSKHHNPSSRPSSKEQKETSSKDPNTPQSKVRRVRRGTSGTVNGTPGPKTRSRRVTDDEDADMNMGMDVPADENGSVEDSTAAAAAINSLAATAGADKVGRRSRMPMPVATRRGVVAGGGMRGSVGGGVAGRSGPGSLTATGGVTEVKKAKESKAQGAKDDGKGDLLGKRRLRVRS